MGWGKKSDASVALMNSQHSLKHVLIEGVFPAEGGNFTFPHSLSSEDTVVGLQGGFSYNGDGLDTRQCMQPNFTDSASYEYEHYVSIGGIEFRDLGAENLYGKRGSFLITYY